MPELTQRFLVRVPASGGAFAAASSRHPLAAAGLELEPLFTTGSPAAMGVAAAEAHEWYVARLPEGDAAGIPPWDAAYEALARIESAPAIAAAAQPDVIEPDLLQPWLHDRFETIEGLAAGGDVCRFDDQDEAVPGVEGRFAWHLDDPFSQLRRARRSVSEDGARIRVAHLDTGYDPNHAALADVRLAAELQRNFVNDERPDDARDPGVDGLLKSPGHGTGTLSILAGGRFQFSADGYDFDDVLGGAPRSEIVPIRVGNSVVQLTTGNVAQGIRYAVDLCSDEQTRVHVMSMSMGGVASAAWADAVNLAYEAGIFFVAAAGNNYSAGLFGFPTHQVVYPARFRRVVAACGVMANRNPYYGMRTGTMQGNWGPEGAMTTALSAYTPNIAWARFGCENIVRMNGAGTSSATPQIAAAAALYLEKHADRLFDPALYPEPWMRVEAVRHALFTSADRSADGGSREKLGNGLLRAKDALDVPPVARTLLRKAPNDSAGFPFLNVLSPFGLAADPTGRMLQLEATQLVQNWKRADAPNPLESAVSDPDRQAADVSQIEVSRFLEAVVEHPEASAPLKQRARDVLDGMSAGRGSSVVPEMPPASDRDTTLTPKRTVHTPFQPPAPPCRKLRAYALDPSFAAQLETAGIAEVTLEVPWEKLDPGPAGEYVEVVDVDPASRTFYEPVDLDAPGLLAQDGLAPSEGIPQFHQQMVYAVCNLTINNFERALGRKTLWRHGPPPRGRHPKNDSNYVQKLRVYPHALREANAYYSPAKVALLFGYFDALDLNDGKMLPGGRVFTCLSHDIIAHETTHAILDGMHQRFLLPTNRDVHAFHEAFADCVAMLQHFTFPEVVAHQIAATRGDIDQQDNVLVQLASQFGFAIGQRTALRDAVGRISGGEWIKEQPDPKAYEATKEPHLRGRILVAAVFDAFLSIYRRRTADLLRLASGGSGVLRPGAIHPDLVNRLADQASKSARHVLTMCIRALDYCPPTDITFGEYLRAIITADCDLVEDDDLNYRVSFIEAFRRRGIFPPGVRTLSVGSLKWRSVGEELLKPSQRLQEDLGWLQGISADSLYAEARHEQFTQQRKLRKQIHDWLEDHFSQSGAAGKRDAEFLGIDPEQSFEVHMARIAFRTRPDGGIAPQLLASVLQTTREPIDKADPSGPQMPFEGGCAVVADLRERRLRYCIRKKSGSAARLARQRQFALSEFDSLRATYYGERSLSVENAREIAEPFALIHRTL